ncbi:platelet endothelial cell adhesion molecule isoform X2 [Thalassophryne amazonica]|uniref:platelet endothelial cell adhesion molecule isoform X2 n=1 Tax=Thalassophryne amazonica TaxID=390379 RepID=UPI001471A50A|nr:platelet endothelial cell adhesion molecule isoform X2 [Thalassophryne amazonica]
MDTRAAKRLLLFTSLLLFWRCARGDLSYTIDGVGLTIYPSRTVESGTAVTLRCEAKVSHDPSLHLMYNFQFIRYDVPVHSAATSNISALYNLTPARAADSGTYECRVSVKEKSKTSDAEMLTVTGLQTPVLLLSKITLYESQEITATCSAPEEKGLLIFRFYQEFMPTGAEMIKQVAPTKNSSETKLVLRRIGDTYLYCDYELAMLPAAGRSNTSNKIQVAVRALYISPTMNILPSTTVYEGEIIEVVCKVIAPPENVQVFLTKDRKILKKASMSLNHRITAKTEDSRELVCKAELDNTQKETRKTITVKEVFSRPQLKVEPAEVFEGERFTLTCSVTIYDHSRITNDTLRYSIFKNSTQLTNTTTYSVVAGPAQNAQYTCKVQTVSLMNSFVKESSSVVVEAKVPVSEPVLSVVGDVLVVGKPFLLLCHSDRGSLPITYVLYGPNRQHHTRVVTKAGDQATFNTSAIYKRDDILKFLCHAKNNAFIPSKISSAEKLLRSTVIIEPVSKPQLTTIPNTEHIAEGQDVTFTCTVQRGTPPINFTWYHSDRGGVLAFKSSPELKESYIIKGVKEEHAGKYYCMSTNQANEVKQSYTVNIEVTLAGWKKGVIAVVCILFVVACILVVAFKKRHLTFKRKRQLDLSGKPKPEEVSLTQAEVTEADNATPQVMGKTVWSEHVSASESEDQKNVTLPENPEVQSTEVQTEDGDSDAVPQESKETTHSKKRNSRQSGVYNTDGESVEYVQLNHDTDPNGDQEIHGEHGVQEDHVADNENIPDADTATNGE